MVSWCLPLRVAVVGKPLENTPHLYEPRCVFLLFSLFWVKLASHAKLHVGA